MHPGQRMKPGRARAVRARRPHAPRGGARAAVLRAAARAPVDRRRRIRDGRDRGDRPRPAAAVHQAARPRPRPGPLPDRVRARARIDRRADGRPALHRSRSSRSLDARGRRADDHHAARRVRHVQAGPRGRGRGAHGGSRALLDLRRRGRAHQRARSTTAGASSPSAPRRRARSRARCGAGDGRVGAGSADTDLFIYPGHDFRAIRALVTNFHLPASSLLMLVSAFAGREAVLGAYREAVRGALSLLQLRRRDADCLTTVRALAEGARAGAETCGRMLPAGRAAPAR